MKLRWTRRALGDLERIADFIAADKPLAAQRFVAELRRKVAMLDEHPLMGQRGPYEDTRELVVHRNYLVTYRLRGDEIQLLQVWHVARQRPR